jgi:hypothetical protein
MGHFQVYLYEAFVAPRATKLQVEQGDVIVDRFGPIVRSNGVLETHLGDGGESTKNGRRGR